MFNKIMLLWGERNFIEIKERRRKGKKHEKSARLSTVHHTAFLVNLFLCSVFLDNA